MIGKCRDKTFFEVPTLFVKKLAFLFNGLLYKVVLQSPFKACLKRFLSFLCKAFLNGNDREM